MGAARGPIVPSSRSFGVVAPARVRGASDAAPRAAALSAPPRSLSARDETRIARPPAPAAREDGARCPLALARARARARKREREREREHPPPPVATQPRLTRATAWRGDGVWRSWGEGVGEGGWGGARCRRGGELSSGQMTVGTTSQRRISSLHNWRVTVIAPPLGRAPRAAAVVARPAGWSSAAGGGGRRRRRARGGLRARVPGDRRARRRRVGLARRGVRAFARSGAGVVFVCVCAGGCACGCAVVCARVRMCGREGGRMMGGGGWFVCVWVCVRMMSARGSSALTRTTNRDSREES